MQQLPLPPLLCYVVSVLLSLNQGYYVIVAFMHVYRYILILYTIFNVFGVLANEVLCKNFKSSLVSLQKYENGL